MINYKISFLIVLISVVCFSADVDPEESNEAAIQRLKNMERCSVTLHKFFKCSHTATTSCLQYAIRHMKLYGYYAQKFDEHVHKYYESFHQYVKLDSIVLPKTFCKKKPPGCEDELKIFKEIPPRNIICKSEASPSGSLDGSTSEVNILKNALSTFDHEASSSGSSNDDRLEKIILKNALYYHVIVDPRQGFKPSENEAKKYFHEIGTNGYHYLLEIARKIKTDTGEFPRPSVFCCKLYSYQRKRQKKGDEDVVKTYLSLD